MPTLLYIRSVVYPRKIIVRRYEGEVRELMVGVDNVEVLKKLRKGRGWCGKWEQKVGEWGKELIERGWKIRWKWIPRHVGIRENEEVDRMAKEGVYMEERSENNVGCWGKWEQRRKERVESVWKEYWKESEKRRGYFGRGKKGEEKGHSRRRRESIFLV